MQSVPVVIRYVLGKVTAFLCDCMHLNNEPRNLRYLDVHYELTLKNGYPVEKRRFFVFLHRRERRFGK